MNFRIFFFIIVICSSCATSKKLHDSRFSEIEYLLNNPSSTIQYSVQYKNYSSNWKEFILDTLVVNVAEYNYKKLDSLLQVLTLKPQSWEVGQLSGIYEKYEQNFFDEYDSFIKAKKWTLDAEIDHSHILDDAIDLVRNIDYLIYAKKRYGGKGFNKGYEIFKKECAIREEFRKREKYKDWRLATKDLDKNDYFKSKKYRTHVIDGNIWPFCGKYTMLDKFVFDKTEFFLMK